MAAFERIPCGIPRLDTTFDNIRLGDNVVWQLGSLDDFASFVEPFVAQAQRDGREVHYMRFASHEPFFEEQPGIQVHEFNPQEGFEAFTIEVRSVITEQGFEAFYVFDSLSDLQVAWSADMMMGNFFRVTCPYLFELDTVAYFPILRGHHSFEAIAKIRDTTQLLIDVYADGPRYFIHPLKVWNRYSPSMFLAHRYTPETGEVQVCTDGVDAARFFALTSELELSKEDQNIDSWDHFFTDAQQSYRQGTLDEGVCARMCNMMMTKDPQMRQMVMRFFEPSDYFAVRGRMIGTGHVGGKACGMLLARKIVKRELPELLPYLEPHDSFYLGTDVFYSYIVANDLWSLRIAQRKEEGFVSAAPALREGLLSGKFPDDIRERFRRILEHYGQSPIIVRSSSYLEDGFGTAFAGKYESIFCTNSGSPEDRLEAFEAAVRRVYASTMDPSALEYRARNGLHVREEQMALLIQRVSGSYYKMGDESPVGGGQVGDEANLPNSSTTRRLFFPTAAGVGYSQAAYRFMEGADPTAGMLRLVAGLGTRAVDRTQDDYPRLVSLDRPRATPASTIAEKHRFSQRHADVLDLSAGDVTEVSVLDLLEVLPQWGIQALFERDSEAEYRLRETGRTQKVYFANCEGLTAHKEFTDLMSRMLRVLQDAYGSPVDIEYTVNVSDGGTFAVNLLQCRPLRVLQEGGRIGVPELSPDETLFTARRSAMGASRSHAVDGVVVVDPERYYRCPYALKPTVAALVERAGAYFKQGGAWFEESGLDREPCVLLIVPGRLGTSSPELGVPVSFAQIAPFSAICECAYSKVGYAPELSYGSHMFQDLVEANIYYAALVEDPEKACYHPEYLDRLTDITDEVLPMGATAAELEGETSETGDRAAYEAVSVYDAREASLHLWHDQRSEQSVCGTFV